MLKPCLVVLIYRNSLKMLYIILSWLTEVIFRWFLHCFFSWKFSIKNEGGKTISKNIFIDKIPIKNRHTSLISPPSSLSFFLFFFFTFVFFFFLNFSSMCTLCIIEKVQAILFPSPIHNNSIVFTLVSFLWKRNLPHSS